MKWIYCFLGVTLLMAGTLTGCKTTDHRPDRPALNERTNMELYKDYLRRRRVRNPAGS